MGLPDNAVKESQQRIDSALREIGSRIPGKRVIINMAPADVKKEGSAYDLPLCIGILAANEQLSPEGLENFMMLGELSLDGSLVAVKGVLPIAINARSEGFKSIIVPLENANEAAVVEGIHVYGFSHIREVTDFLNGKQQAEQMCIRDSCCTIPFMTQFMRDSIRSFSLSAKVSPKNLSIL